MTTNTKAKKNTPARTIPRSKPRPRHESAKPKAGFAFERTAGEETWLTPRWLVDALDLPNVADVDPCAPPVRFWNTAKRHFNKQQDGFNREWNRRDFYWVNPPYGRECAMWMDKLADHGNGLLLVFARTDTAAFHEAVFGHPNVSALFFFKGRLKFVNGQGEEVGSAGAPSVLIAFGKKSVGVLRRAIGRGALDGHLLLLSR